ncbi:MAG: hypothetical protein R2860_04415 [Desulfobacterales bacterium]
MFINGAARDVESLALQTGSTKPEPWQKEMALSAFLQGNPQFVSMALFAGRIRCCLGHAGKWREASGG